MWEQTKKCALPWFPFAYFITMGPCNQLRTLPCIKIGGRACYTQIDEAQCPSFRSSGSREAWELAFPARSWVMRCCQYRDCTLRTAALFIISQRGHHTADLNQFLFSLFAYGRETGELMWEFLMKNTYWQKIIYLKTYYRLWPQKRNTMHKITWDEEAKSSFSQGSSATVCLSLVLLLQMDHTIWYQMDIVEAGSIYMQNLSNQQSSCIFNPAGLFDITMLNYLSATQLTGLNQGMRLQQVIGHSVSFSGKFTFGIQTQSESLCHCSKKWCKSTSEHVFHGLDSLN